MPLIRLGEVILYSRSRQRAALTERRGAASILCANFFGYRPADH